MKAKQFCYVKRDKGGVKKKSLAAGRLIHSLVVNNTNVGWAMLAGANDMLTDAEMYLRMGYRPNQIELLPCSRPGDPPRAIYRVYPKSASKLQGMRRSRG